MGVIRCFEDIEAWQGARELARLVYDLTKREPFCRDFEMRDQIRRAAVSVMSNIAEGYESQTSAVFIRYLDISKGSAGELRSQSYVALDQNYLTRKEFETLLALSLSKRVARQLASFKCDSWHPILQTASDLIAIERPLSVE